MIEDEELDEARENESKSKLRLSLEKFTFRSPQPSPKPSRRSERGMALEEPVRVISRLPSPVKKRQLTTALNDSPTKAKKQRGYAGPEKYAHLDHLTDCLGDYLDVLFCGINPGVRSATEGHHFAHPGNRFYKMLHGSGFTDRLVPPAEDHTLPALYNIGIINLVDRPSSCEDELSSKEMVEGVPSLLRKVVKYKPRFICFIGKGMSERVERGFKLAIARNRSSSQYFDTSQEPARTTTPSRKRHKGASLARHTDNSDSADSGIGLRPFKITHADNTGPVKETLFFCSHSSSGLATSMNLQEKTDVLKQLREFVAKHKVGTLDTSTFEEVPVEFDTVQTAQVT
ncbi:DNA glycosylase [Fomitiporia mediterranea MF3/22]|uniref:DNA glycosylase n=1 Tax=Fomitiporia mediterranea (strain MF3/22) TaxID=694068 RepID=UPI0004409C95|nr:DNA glycosylase [Fomitiporia mediterranea MF3/22]EJD05586.1 DNA glycosylase [Fomitiporia mediterranea MF3/22]